MKRHILALGNSRSSSPASPGSVLGAESGSAFAAAAGSDWRWLAGLVLLLLTLSGLPFLFEALFGDGADFQLHRVTLILILALAALAQNLLTGYAAQPSLGNAAFFGISAYLLAWLSSDLQQPYWLAVLVALVACALLGLLVGGPALSVSGAYLAIATLGLVVLTGSLLTLWDTSAGRQSYELTALPEVLGDDRSLYYCVLAVVVLIFVGAFHLLRSRVGRAWIALRDSEVAAAACGVALTRYKLLAFVVSAVLTGLAGVLYATWGTTATASMSSVEQTIAFLTMIVVGGPGSLLGSLLGALFVGLVPLLLGELPDPLALGPLQLPIAMLTTGIYGVLLLLALIFFPGGLSAIFARRPFVHASEEGESYGP
ncbi:branched-chain amino acid ABC transporter permease [Thermogemmatispora sp.]|uniref:branched-chain amino acid ABC transporter permease n=1 Tax=Thermogemmatispora sp. TaxID=1968838 RepID=UPI001D55B899|nr:branched-chain amino acid ABC transporter permease [Thermogemmatispora sp.]MBX5448978.1 branched-chain amino acid ABC transporter permease [Thermogemmatispora sp.]